MALALLYNGNVSAQAAVSTSAKAACVIELTSGRVLYAQNDKEQLPMASTTKVMTALLALESGDMDAKVTCMKNSFGVPGTSIYLSLGETLCMEDMVTGLMLASGNDAAVAIAEHLGGSVEGFAQIMNARAKQIGANNTCFITPHGLPQEGHYTTAYDLAIIARTAMCRRDFRELVSTQRSSIPWAEHDYNRTLVNKNRLLSTYEGATGIKTGYTRAAGRCLVFGAKRDGLELVGVVLNCADWFDESARLMDACFNTYDMLTVAESASALGEVSVNGGLLSTVAVTIQQDLAAPVKEGEAAQLWLDMAESCTAPVYAGQRLGTARMLIDDQIVCETPVFAAHNVDKLTFWTQAQSVLRNWIVQLGIK